MKRSFADIMAGLDSDRAQKVARKLPAWAAVDGIEIPSALSLEQCSSSATALYKQALIASRSGELAADVPLGTVLDLTGGLGVDSWAFALVSERVVYFERSEELAAAAGRNFQRLGAGNIDVRCETVTPQTELPEADLIYADPARRDAAGRKVFLLEDCTPDILTLLPMLLRKAPAVLVKLSPMADLAMLAERFGPALREIHVVECDGEVKELLCLLLRDNSSPEPNIVVARLSGQTLASRSGSLRFRMSEERAAEAVYAAGVQPGDVLLEPCPALLKAGAFRLPCTRWALRKLAPSTHLYLAPVDVAACSSEAKSAPADRPAPGLCASKVGKGFMAAGGFGGYAPAFKVWRVCDTLPFGAAAFKALKQRYPRADVTARNLPLGSAELQKRLGIASGGAVHIFGCRLTDGSSVLLVTESI